MSTFSFGFGDDNAGGAGSAAAAAVEATPVTNSNLAGAADQVALVARCSEIMVPPSSMAEAEGDDLAHRAAMVAGFLGGYTLKAVNPELAENEIAIAAAAKEEEARAQERETGASGAAAALEGTSDRAASAVRTSVLTASAHKADLVKGIYEGGMKVWECTHDLVNYMIAAGVTFKDGVRVLELGCGAGLPGLYAWREGGLVDFADYNVEVLEHITIPNMLLNANIANGGGSGGGAAGGGAAGGSGGVSNEEGSIPNGTINGRPQYIIDHGPLTSDGGAAEEDADDAVDSDDSDFQDGLVSRLSRFIGNEEEEGGDDDDDDDGKQGGSGGGGSGGGNASASAASSSLASSSKRPKKRAKTEKDAGSTAQQLQEAAAPLRQRINNYQPRFFGGGWADLPAFLSSEAKSGHDGQGTYDVILTSETIYSMESCQDLYNAIARCIQQPGGVVYVAAKTYYFGVGGGTLSFTQLVNDEGAFDIQSVWKSDVGVAREILKMTLK